MPKISVIVPVYKAEKFLSACIESILNQTYHDFEVILVDDGSPDSSGQICEEYAKKDSRIKVIHQKNAGVAASRNVGLDIAVGEYITFVDSDDYIQFQMYEKMLKCALDNDCDFVMCDCMKVYSDGRKAIYSHNIRGGLYDEKQLRQEYYPHLLIMPSIEYPATISNYVCMFKNRGQKMPRYEVGIRYSEDWLFGCQIMLRAHSFYYMKGQAYYFYNCDNQNSVTHTFGFDKWNDYKILFSRFQEEFGNKNIFDFNDQLDKVLLFFVYNSVGDILNSGCLSWRKKIKVASKILHEDIVVGMFKRLDIGDLCISQKQKILTFCYAHPVTILLLLLYLEIGKRVKEIHES